MTTEPEDIERELRTLGALGSPAFGRRPLREASASPLQDVDRVLLRELTRRARERMVRIEEQQRATQAQLDGLRTLVEDMNALISATSSPTQPPTETEANGTHVHEES